MRPVATDLQRWAERALDAIPAALAPDVLAEVCGVLDERLIAEIRAAVVEYGIEPAHAAAIVEAWAARVRRALH
jgi:hypothetical protein